ncbi:MAG: ABC transporter substrate-binding protein, partial [Acidimicrobiales bacterium]
FQTDPQGGGDVSIVPEDNATSIQRFRSGSIDGAWVPEPWVAQLVRVGGGKVLVDEATQWPRGRFATAELLVRTDFLNQHPGLVADLVLGQLRANDYVNQNPAASQQIVHQAITQLTGSALPASLVAAAWQDLTFTDDPVASSLSVSAQHAHAVGLLGNVNLKGIFDLGPLNQALAKAGEPQVSSS